MENYPNNLARRCPKDLQFEKCKTTEACDAKAILHVCIAYAKGECVHGGVGVTHRADAHTRKKCGKRRMEDCGKAMCYQPNAITVLHTRFTCRSIKHNVPCKWNATGICLGGHDYENIRRLKIQERETQNSSVPDTVICAPEDRELPVSLFGAQVLQL